MDPPRGHRLGRRLAALLVVAAAAAGLTACGASSPSAHGRLAVVAAEDTWGAVAAQVGGDAVTVTSLITNPNADPHEYTANADDALAVHDASIVVVNGAHYDAFMGQLLAASGTSPDVLTVARIAGARGSNPNPHFWYALGTVRLVAAALAHAYEQHDHARAAYFAARLVAFDASLRPIAAVVAAIRARFAGAPVAYTERVPGYLLAAAGLRVLTPTGYARAIEAGTEPDLSDTLAMDALVSHHQIRVLLYNTQTVTPVTTQLRESALADHVPVVGVSETLPASTSFQRWQLVQDEALLHALGGS